MKLRIAPNPCTRGIRFFVPILTALVLSCCAQSTKNLTVVDNFNSKQYMGMWYEIARFPHRFERGLTNVTATYSLIENNTVRVINRGYLPEKGEWKEAKGKARFADLPDRAHLKVTFFWPFYGAYKVLVLDQTHYRYALVTGPSYDYLWILARSPQIDAATYEHLTKQAEEMGFETARLERVDQSMHIKKISDN